MKSQYLDLSFSVSKYNKTRVLLGREERIGSGMYMNILVDLNANARLFLIKISHMSIHLISYDDLIFNNVTFF